MVFEASGAGAAPSRAQSRGALAPSRAVCLASLEWSSTEVGVFTLLPLQELLRICFPLHSSRLYYAPNKGLLGTYPSTKRCKRNPRGEGNSSSLASGIS